MYDSTCSCRQKKQPQSYESSRSADCSSSGGKCWSFLMRFGSVYPAQDGESWIRAAMHCRSGRRLLSPSAADTLAHPPACPSRPNYSPSTTTTAATKTPFLGTALLERSSLPHTLIGHGLPSCCRLWHW